MLSAGKPAQIPPPPSVPADVSGGNDAELVNILNQCVYQWTVFNKFQEGVTAIAKLKGEKWAQKLDASVWARGCAGQLKVSQDIMNSAEFSKRLDNLISATKKKLDPKYGFHSLPLDVTKQANISGASCITRGAHNTMNEYCPIANNRRYAKFFAEDLSADCDKVSWSTWIYVCAWLDGLFSFLCFFVLFCQRSIESRQQFLSYGVSYHRSPQTNERPRRSHE